MSLKYKIGDIEVITKFVKIVANEEKLLETEMLPNSS